jgi:hypothetical protein
VTRGRLLAAGVALVTLVAVVLGAVFVAGWWRGDGGSYAPRRLVVRTSVTPSRTLFGQVVTATVQIVVDPRRIDPRSIQVQGRFAPFAVRDEHDTRGRIGRAQVRTFSFALQCLSSACMPRAPKLARARGAATTFALHTANLTARDAKGHAVRVSVRWPVFGVQSRLTEQDIALGEPKIESPLAAPPVTWRVRPVVLGAVASALALVLLLGAGGLIASVALGDGRPLRVLRIPRNLTPVERALRLAEHAARHGETDESRKALERLAVELRRRGAAHHATDAERLAWSAGRPTEERVEELAAAVRSNGAR